MLFVFFAICIWNGGKILKYCKTANLVCIFKKGDPSLPENYRPISLLAIGYKILSSILLNRMREGGGQRKIWPFQFDFRQHVGTAEALFIARQSIERTWNEKDGKIILPALDWVKTCDAISPDSLIGTPKRFGIPRISIDLINDIYLNPNFYVNEAGAESKQCEQKFGISKDCPLSPFLSTYLWPYYFTTFRRK